MKHMKKLFAFLGTVILATSITGCNKKSKEPLLENYSIHRDAEFGGAYIDTSIQSFNDLGFKFGDCQSFLYFV